MSRVSVIVPCYNYARFLPYALESVVAQTHQDWECIVVDDGSTDDTSEVARRFGERDARIRTVRQDNAGPAAARNHALRLSSGEYVQLLDADDKLGPGKLAVHSRYLDEHRDADLVYSACTYFRTEEPDKVLHSLYGHLSRSMHPKVHGRDEALETLQEFNITQPSTMLLRRGAIERAGEFVETSRGCEDWDLWLRCAVAGCSIVYLETGSAVALVRAHATSASRSTERMLRGLVAAARAFPQTRAAAYWHEPMLPRVYEMSLGIDLIEHGRRIAGVRKIWRAARAARATLTRIRWLVYAAAGALLPRRLFHRIVIIPMPERGLEWIRRLKTYTANR
ncbi:MAG TPA: glycosyltransferase family 2 protein [Thermoanaerobaculia bacterium]|nr:glycosyltransferase family 2 protein [Thermoanaerobaculia bacterium]